MLVFLVLSFLTQDAFFLVSPTDVLLGLLTMEEGLSLTLLSAFGTLFLPEDWLVQP